MKEFIKSILNDELADEISNKRVENVEIFFNKSQLIQYLDYKMGAIYGNSRSRRSLANIYMQFTLYFIFILMIFLIDLKSIEVLVDMNILSYLIFIEVYMVEKNYKIMRLTLV